MLVVSSYSSVMDTNCYGNFTPRDERDEQKEKLSLNSAVPTLAVPNVTYLNTGDSKIVSTADEITLHTSTQRIRIQSLLNDDNSFDTNCVHTTEKFPARFPVDEKQSLNAARILASIYPTTMVAIEPLHHSPTFSQTHDSSNSPTQSPTLYNSQPQDENSSSQSDSDHSVDSPRSKPKRAKSNLMLQMCSELWMKHYTQLKEYHRVYGNTNVTRTKPEWKTLGNWVAEQRRKLKNGKLSREQLKLLNTLGFEWDRQQFSKGNKKSVKEESQQVQFVVLDPRK